MIQNDRQVQQKPLIIHQTVVVSGEIPREPVVSLKTGHLFEKSLIEKYLAEQHCCPVTGSEMSSSDLLPLQTSTIPHPRPPTATSIPSMLSMLQNEWDALMLETFTLKKQYQEALQELSHALYQQDAASRVIARLLKERDEAREALVNFTSTPANGTNSNTHNMEVDNARVEEESQPLENQQIPSDILEDVTHTAESLSKSRKKRKMPEGLASVQDLQAYTQTQSFPDLLPKSETEGGVVIAINEQLGLAAVCCGDGSSSTAAEKKSIYLVDAKSGQVTATLKGHTKKVTSVAWFISKDGKSMLLSGSSDKSIKIWSHSEDDTTQWSVDHSIKHHKAEVTAISLHPTGRYFLSVGADGLWCFCRSSDGELIASCASETGEEYSSCAFHPDGLIFATGSIGGKVTIWDIKTQTIAFECPESHDNAVTSLSFSENGYYFATVGRQDNSVKIWDLRKLAKVHEIESNQPIQKVLFDKSGSYIATLTSSAVKIYQSKHWNEVALFENDTDECHLSGFAFGDNINSFIVAIRSDGSLVIYSTTQ